MEEETNSKILQPMNSSINLPTLTPGDSKNQKEQESELEIPARSGADFYTKLLDQGNINPFGAPIRGPSEQNEGDDLTKIGLEERISSKNWKHNLSAVQELAKVFKSEENSNTPINQEKIEKARNNFPFLVKSASHNVPQLMQESLSVLISLIKFQEPSDNQGKVKQLITLLIEKVFSKKNSAIKKAANVLLVTAFKKSHKEEFIRAVRENCTTKNPKNQANCVTLMVDLLSAFGPKRMNILEFSDIIEKWNSTKNFVLRKELQNYHLQLMIWLGEESKNLFSWLNPTQLKDLEKVYSKKMEETEGKRPQPSERPAASKVNEETGKMEEEVFEDKEDSKVDMYEMCKPVIVISKFPESWCEATLKLPKWKDKKAKTDELIKKLSVPKIQKQDCFHLIQFAKKLLIDSNMLVQINGIQIIAKLCTGLRLDLGNLAKKITLPILHKLKERNKKVAKAAVNALVESLVVSTPVAVWSEVKDILLGNNTVQIMNLYDFLDKFIEKGTESDLIIFSDEYIKVAGDLTSTGSIEIRKGNSKLLKILKKRLPNSKNLAEFIDSNNISNGGQSEAKTTPKPNSKGGNSSKQNLIKKMGGEGMRSKSKQKKIGKNKRISDVDNSANLTGKVDLRSTMELEEAKSQIESLNLPAQLIKDLIGDTWKAKVASLEELPSLFIASIPKKQSSGVIVEAFLVLLKETSKQFKDSNFKVVNSIMQTITTLAEAHEKILITGKSTFLISLFISKKANMTKLHKAFYHLTDVFSKHHKLRWLLVALSEQANTQKLSPVIINDILKLFENCADKYPKLVPKKELLQTAKQASSITHPNTKKSMIKLFKKMYQIAGEQLVSVYTLNLDKKIQKTLEKEFETIQPSVVLEEETNESEGGSNIPKKDVSSALNKLIDSLNHKKWIERKKALERAEVILKATAYSIKAKGLNDFVSTIRQRLEDSILQVQIATFKFLQVFTKSLKEDFKVYSKNLLPLSINFLSQKNPVIKNDAINYLKEVSKFIGEDKVITQLLYKLKLPNVDLKISVLELLQNFRGNLSKIPPQKSSKNLLSCYIDKSKVIRNLSKELIKKALNSQNLSFWKKTASKFPPIQNENMNILLNSCVSSKMEEEKNQGKSSKVKELGPGIPNINSKYSKRTVSGKSSRVKLVPAEEILGKISKMSKPNYPVMTELPPSLQKQIQPDSNAALPYNDISLLPTNFQTSNQNSSDSKNMLSSEKLVFINFNEPSNQDSGALISQFLLLFGEVMTEKLQSASMVSLNEVLVSILGISRTNYSRFKDLLHLLYSWVYIKVFKTNNHQLVQLYSKFVETSIDMHSNRPCPPINTPSTNPSTYQGVDYLLPLTNLIGLIFDQLSTPSNDEFSMIFLENVSRKIGGSRVLAAPVFEYYIDCLDKGIAQNQFLLFKMLSKIIEGESSLKNLVSTRALTTLKTWIGKYAQLEGEFMSDFVRILYEKHGNEGLQICGIKDLPCVKSFIGLMYPAANELMLTQDILNRMVEQLNSGDPGVTGVAISEFKGILNEDLEASLPQLRRSASALVLGLTSCLVLLFETLEVNIEKDDFLELLLKISKIADFMDCINERALTNLLHGLAGLMVRTEEAKNSSNLEAFQNKFMEWQKKCQLISVTLITASQKDKVFCSLLALFQSQTREIVAHKGEKSVKTLFVIFRNLLNMRLVDLKKNPKNINYLDVSTILKRAALYLEEFGDVPSNPGNKMIKTLVKTFSELKGPQIFEILPKRDQNPSHGMVIVLDWLDVMQGRMKLEPPIVDVMIKDLNSIILSHSEQSENVRDLQKIEEEISKFFEGNFGLLPTSKRNEFKQKLMALGANTVKTDIALKIFQVHLDEQAKVLYQGTERGMEIEESKVEEDGDLTEKQGLSRFQETTQAQIIHSLLRSKINQLQWITYQSIFSHSITSFQH